jgi:uncharacterized protein (TIGR02147 family)
VYAETQSTAERPVPEAFDDHRLYLQAMVTFLKRTTPGFSYRKFARRAGFASPSFLKLVEQGRRNLSDASIGRFATAFALNAQEREGFELLVRFGQAKDDHERNRYYAKLARRRTGRRPVELNRDQYEAYSRWYIMPIRELVARADFVEDGAWIAARLRPNIRPAEATAALSLLLRLGLLVRSESGRLVPAEPKLTATKGVQQLAVRNYHRAMLEHAHAALDHVPVDERNVTSLTVALTREQYQTVCQRLAEVQRELLDLIDDAPPSDAPRAVHILGFQVVPVSHFGTNAAAASAETHKRDKP